ncbi:MAG TPA: hypothetical protein VK894_03735 [Jiangellales bacterium]|nr:hypothetical protein [Jiangellales bacterium]
MSTDPQLRSPGRSDPESSDTGPARTDPRLEQVLHGLVEDGTLVPRQAAAVGAAVAPLLAVQASPATTGAPVPPVGSAPAPAGLRTRLSEIAGYVGAALVVGAAFFFVADQWTELTTGGRIGVLAGIAVTLWLAAAAVLVTAPGGVAAIRSGEEPARRRLDSTLLTGAAAAAAFAVGVALEAGSASERVTVVVAALAGLVAVAGGYVLAPSLVGQLAAAAAAVTATVALVSPADDATPVGLSLVALGALWAAAVGAGVFRERIGGTLVSGGLALFGAQIIYAEDSTRPWSYLLTLAVVVIAFTVYTRWPAWPLLGVGVVGATLLVPEFLSDVTGGSLGVSGVMLAAGVALLASSAVGLRLRRDAGRDPGGAAHG